VSRGRQAVLALLSLVTICLGCDEPRRPDIIVITVDTLRADHLGVYAEESRTPRLDAFAAEATVFEHTTAPMPLTRPSHFSMLTSLYPREHGVMNNAMRLPDSALTLTEILADNGYRTGGFVGVKLLGPDSGADQGFGFYQQPTIARERNAQEVVREALEWVAALDDDAPYFLWVHLFDPHLPYAPPDPFRGDVPADRPRITWKLLGEIAQDNDGDVPAAYLEEGKALYRGEVAYVDQWVGELLRGLGGSDDKLVVFTADHGECFENGVYFEHADCLWEGGLHIPLIVRYPPEFDAGARVAGQTSIVDVAPTVLRAAGIESPEKFSGQALQRRTGLAERQVLVQHPFYQPAAAERRPQRIASVLSVGGEPVNRILVDQERVGLVTAEWKYLRTGEQEQLYRLGPDPDERTNRVETEPDVAAEFGRLLEQQLDEHPWNVIESPEINEELLETLKALGYVGGG